MGTPITLSIADATVEEGPDAKLDFVVSLSRAADHAVTGKYVASNGTAHGNVDYELTLGSFTIAVAKRKQRSPLPCWMIPTMKARKP